MFDIVRHSHGELRMPVETALFIYNVKHRDDLEISVPAVMVGREFMFNFSAYLATLGVGSESRVSVVRNIAELYVEYETLLGRPIMKNGKGLSADEPIDEDEDSPFEDWDTSVMQKTVAYQHLYEIFGERLPLVLREAHFGIKRSLISKNLAQAMLLSAVNTDNDFFSIMTETQTTINRKVVLDIIKSIHQVFSDIVLSENWDNVVQVIKTAVNREFFKRLSALKAAFQERQSTSVIMTKSEVMRQMLPFFSDIEPDYKYYRFQNNLFEKVESIDTTLKDVPRAAFIAFHRCMVKAWNTSGDKYDPVYAPTTLVDYLRLNYLSSPSFMSIPQELTQSAFLNHPIQSGDFEKVEKFFFKQMAKHIIECVTTGSPEGDLKARILGLIRDRSFKAADIEQVLVNRNLTLLSYAHYAMCAALDDVRAIIESTVVCFPYEEQWKEQLVLQYWKAVTAKDGTKFLQSDHSRSITETPELVKKLSDLDGAVSPLTFSQDDIPNYFFSDDLQDNYTRLKYSIYSDRYRGWVLRKEPLSGTIQDAPAEIPPQLIRLQVAAKDEPEVDRFKLIPDLPYYYIRASLKFPLIETPAGINAFRVVNPLVLYKAKILNWTRRMCSEQNWVNAADYARAHNISLRAAHEILNIRIQDTSPTGYKPFGSIIAASGDFISDELTNNDWHDGISFLRVMTYEGPLESIVYWDPKIAPVYEFGPAPTTDNPYLVQFKDYYPVFCYIEENGFNVEANEIGKFLGGDKQALGGNKLVQPKDLSDSEIIKDVEKKRAASAPRKDDSVGENNPVTTPIPPKGDNGGTGGAIVPDVSESTENFDSFIDKKGKAPKVKKDEPDPSKPDTGTTPAESASKDAQENKKNGGKRRGKKDLDGGEVNDF